MDVDKSSLRDHLIALTGDLRPSAEVSQQKLEEARMAIAQAVAAGRQEPLTAARAFRRPVGRRALDKEQRAAIESVVDAVLSRPDAKAEFVAARREITDLATGWAAGRAAHSSFGPFLDARGRPVWIDLFLIVERFRLVRAAGAPPFLTVPLDSPPASGDRFPLPAGSVWIESRQIATNAPADAYTGLRIRGGTLTFSQVVTVTGNEIVVPAAVTCTLSLDLDAGLTPPGTGPGEDARRMRVETPATATLVFTSTGATIPSFANARLTVYGSTVELTPPAGTPTYDTAATVIFVPARTSATSFAVADVQSAEFRPDGRAGITGTAWVLPTGRGPGGDASGAGGLALMLDSGLTFRWKVQPNPVPAGPFTLIASPGLIMLFAPAVQGLGTRATIPLWSSSRIDLRWASKFALQYFSSSAGVEVLYVPGSINGSFDRPVTVAGKRVFVQSKAATIVFGALPERAGFAVEATLDPAPPPVTALAFAIANAVFRTTPAKTLRIDADYDGTQSPAGEAIVTFDLQHLLHTLPDPYATNDELPDPQDPGFAEPMTATVEWSAGRTPVLNYDVPTVDTDRPAVLLDLSTNVDLFGVAWGWAEASGEEELAVESMYLAGTSHSVQVLTLPAVHWEPVFTETQLPPPAPSFPTPFTFGGSGGPTRIFVQSVDLVRIAPAPALDFLVTNFTTGPSPQPAGAELTLPFGIIARSTLVKPGVADPRGATVDYNRPRFGAESVRGGHQISIRAVDPAPGTSLSLKGYSYQYREPPPLDRSVLDDPVHDIFNNYFNGSHQQVPVDRLDLSGYGESIFSNWRNTDDTVGISQVRFDVLIGRTSMEVVQARSILYPYGVRVVRTITIHRKNSGTVIRKDSGWQAASAGEYQFPGLTTHPGVVQRIVNVTNIRDTGQFIDLAGGARVAGVLFDGELQIENAVKGSGPAGVPVRDQIGYVQIQPTGTILTPAQYEELIRKAGPLGGPLDCVFNVGNSGQLMKLGRVGVGVAPTVGGPEFVMTAWGSPQFPQGGQWSVLRQTGSTAPEVVDRDLGTPLVRAGAAGGPPPTTPYVFADAEALHDPPITTTDYGILHATGTQRVFFPRPKIETGSNRITSTRVPVLADPYLLASAAGVFPRLDSAIPFPDANYALVISGANYRLEMPSPNFPITVGPRVLAKAAGVTNVADYAGSVVELKIDTAAAVPWSFRLTNAKFATSTVPMGELVRVTSTVDAAAYKVTEMKDPSITFGGAFSSLNSVLSFLNTLGFPMPLNVSMTNFHWALVVTLKVPIDELINDMLPPVIRMTDTDVAISVLVTGPEVEVEFSLGAGFMVATGLGPLMAVGKFRMLIKVSTGTGSTFMLIASVGVGIAQHFAIFEFKSYFVQTMFHVLGDSAVGFGVGCLFKASLNIAHLIEVEIVVEFRMAVLHVPCPPDGYTVYGVAQVTFAVEITLFWVINISFDLEWEHEQNLNGGRCALPDVL